MLKLTNVSDAAFASRTCDESFDDTRSLLSMIETPRQKTAIRPPINGRTTGHRKTRTAGWTSFASEADRIESAAEIGLVAAGIVAGRIAVAEIALVED